MVDTVGVDDADDLYALDLADFTAARNALAKRLKADGRKDEAAAVTALRKPNAPAWALNQAAREDPELVGAAMTAGTELRNATDAAVRGDASALRAASAADRKASDALVEAAASRLPGGGQAARSRIADTIRAAVLDEHIADRLRRGVLDSDYAQPAMGFGFGFGGGGTDAGIDDATIDGAASPLATVTDLGEARSAKQRAAAKKADKERERAEAERKRQDEEEARARRRRRAELAEAAKRAERRAERLVARAERAEADAVEARAEADAAVAEADEARGAADADVDADVED